MLLRRHCLGNDADINETNAILNEGLWEIALFEDGDTTLTSNYDMYKFNFLENGGFKFINPNEVVADYGAWLVYRNEGLFFGLNFGSESTFNEFNQHGISFASGNLQELVSHNEISRNILRNNSYYGIKINVISSNNTFHHNSFIDNGYLPQAYDSSENDNTWYDPTTKEGNYWSDLIECESYTLAGEDDKVSDRYPLDENLIIYCERNISFDISSFLLIGTLSLISVSILIIKRKLIELK